MKEIKLLLVCTFIALAFGLQAQDERSPKIEEMHNRKFQFLMTEARLTPQEAAQVKPIFLTYEKALWVLSQRNRDSFRAAMGEPKESHPNFARLNDQYVDFEFKQAQLFRNYHFQLKKILAPETLFNYYRAERQFKRKLLRDFHGQRPSERPEPQ